MRARSLRLDLDETGRRQSVHLSAYQACFSGLLAHLPPSWAHLCHQRLPTEVDVVQRSDGELARSVLGHAAVAHPAKVPQSLEYAEHMRHARSDT